MTSEHAGAQGSDLSTHAHEGDVVLFNIGMTVRSWHRPDLWWPVFIGMKRMLDELYANREAAGCGEADDLGFLGAVNMVGEAGVWVTQYWRSTDQLYAYARNRDARHLPAWREFNRAARAHPGRVGIWHETFAVPAAGIETFYGNGARVGLGRFAGTVPVGRRGRSAGQRLGGVLRPAGQTLSG